MYCLSDEQIDYILNDIRRNGVEMEDLQLNLLDHICCIIEQELKEDDDFEQFYRQTVKRFYRTNLREIEEETIDLLTFKNYYAMKKALIVSGASSVTAFIAGSFFKFMYLPGASILLTLGIVSFSLLFLPLLFILKSREVKAVSDKFVIAIGILVGIMFSLAILFIMMHWPGANILLFSAIGGAAFVLLPAYFFTGIRRPETKLNTILMSIILVGIIGLQFTIARLRPSPFDKVATANFVQNEALLKVLVPAQPSAAAAGIYKTCNELKELLLRQAVGASAIPADYDERKLYLHDSKLGDAFYENGPGVQLLTTLKEQAKQFNSGAQNGVMVIGAGMPALVDDPQRVAHNYGCISLLNSIEQLQVYVAVADAKNTTAAK